MLILGIDPGTAVMGYGIIESRDDEISLVDYGTITTLPRSLIGERLNFLYGKLMDIISHYKPESVAVEQPFVSKNVKSALAIGRAQAVVIMVAANREIPCYEYTPAQIKQRITNYGASSKEQIQEMIRVQLRLPHIPEPNDAADALAVAICHLQEIHLSDLLSQQ
jgi:crossover junction endodeoxyribonuclease RuvC